MNETHEAFGLVTWEEKLDPCNDMGTLAHDGHSSAVAGALAARVFETVPGSSNTTRPPAGLVGLFGGRLFTANLCGSISARLLERSPHMINVSCMDGPLIGPVSKASKVPYDHAVFSSRVFVASGAGNSVSGDETQQYVSCPSYNAVCVGGYWYGSTVGLGSFGDDSPMHRFRNDPATGREKPDLVAPAGGRLPHWQVSSTFGNAIYRGDLSGTSFSTPFVVGTAGLLMANYSRQLVGNPTLVRGVLMASASHAIPGGPAVPLFNDGIDDKSGAGVPRGDRGRRIMEDDTFWPPPDGTTKKVDNLTDKTAHFNATTGYLNAFIVFQVDAGDKVRVVLTYDQCQVDTVALNDTLIADLDLIVYQDVLGVRTTHLNNSHVDNTEIVDFTAAQDAQITVKVKKQHWDPCSDGSTKTYMSIVWDAVPASAQ